MEVEVTVAVEMEDNIYVVRNLHSPFHKHKNLR